METINKKQSSIEWLYERLERMIPRTTLYNIDKKQFLEQAKAMHKEEIIDAANKLLYRGTGPGDTAAEQYYNETFGGQDNE